MTIIYAAIAKPDAILCSNVVQGNSIYSFETIVQEFLSDTLKNTKGNQFERNGYMYYFLNKNSLYYVAVVDTTVSATTAKEFLKQIDKLFQSSKLPALLPLAKSHSFDIDFKQTLDKEMQSVKLGGYGQLHLLSDQVEEVKIISKNNIEKVLYRGENLATLEDRSQALQDSALEFKTTSTKIHRKYWWQNMKMKIIIISVVVVILLIIIIVILSETGAFKKKPNPSGQTTKANIL